MELSATHAAQVASSFVRQYYLTLHDNPNDTWKFYMDDSHLTHGDEESVTGLTV